MRRSATRKLETSTWPSTPTKACADIQYQVPNVYLFISNLLRDNGREEEALNTLAEARGLYPREQSLIIEELNIYLTNEEFDKAKENLTLAAEQDLTNEILWFSLTSVLDNLGNADEAIEAYKKALAVKNGLFRCELQPRCIVFQPGRSRHECCQ